jgi:hypothetical protein
MMPAEYKIPTGHYDGLVHVIPFEIGADFSAKYDAYRADGFSVSIHGEGCIHAFKAMPGDSGIPLYARDQCAG